MKLIVLISILFATFSVQANPYNSKVWGEKKAAQMFEREKKIAKTCFDVPWSQVQPIFRTKAEIVKEWGNQYNSGKWDPAGTAFLTGFEMVMGTMSTPVFHAARFPGAVLLERVIQQARALPDFHKTDYAQRACLIQCITSEIIEYDYAALDFIAKPNKKSATSMARNLLDMIFPAPYAVNDGYGVCREFSKIYNTIAWPLGIRSLTTTGPRHAFNLIPTPTGPMYLEPQSMNCTLWR